MSNKLQPRKIVLSICEPGEYSGEEAHSLLNKIAKALHEAIMAECSFFDKPILVQSFYAMFDESFYYLFLGKHFSTKNTSVIEQIEKAPTSFRYLLEIAIQCNDVENQQSRDLTKDALTSFVGGASFLIEACLFSNYLYRNDFNGGFTVEQNGDLSFEISEAVTNSGVGFVRKIGLLNKKIRPDPEKIRFVNSPKKESLKSEAYRYDVPFLKQYGIKMSTIVECMETIIRYVCKKRYGVEKISQNELLKNIKRKTPYKKASIKKALNFLEIDKEMLSKDYKYYELYNVPISVSRRPIIRLFHGLGNKGDKVYFGRNILLRSLMLLFADVDRGFIKIGDVADNWAKEKGPQFEKQLKSLLVGRGFKVLRVTDAPAKVGEIDAIAFHENTKLLLIIEAKASGIDLSMEKAKWHFERSRKWIKKLDRKVKWVKANTKKLTKRLTSHEINPDKAIGLIITRVPWYVENDLPYDILSLEEFERFLDEKGICS